MRIQDLAVQLLNFINSVIIPLLIAFAVVVFFWGIVKYIKGAGNGKEHDAGIKTMTAGIIGLVVMLGLWGIISLVSRTIGINGSGGALPPPQVGSGSSYVGPSGTI